jgi:hypothetical protein
MSAILLCEANLKHLWSIGEHVPIPVRILPRYSRGVHTGLGVRARVNHPSTKGTLRASRAVRRPNRSRSGPHSKHPNGVAIDATLAETRDRSN